MSFGGKQLESVYEPIREGTVLERVYMSYRAQTVSTLSPKSKAHAGEWGTREGRSVYYN